MRTAVAGVPDIEPSWAAAISAGTTAILGGCGLWLANRLMGKAAFQTAINNGFKGLLDELQEDRKRLLETLDAERKAFANERLHAAGEAAQLRGDILNLTQVIESLKAQLRLHGIPIPESRKPSPEQIAAGLIVLDPTPLPEPPSAPEP